MDDAPSLGPPLTEELAAGLAHEVRNRLNSLQIHLGILEQDLADAAPGAQGSIPAQLQRIAKVVAELDDFVSDFLRFAHAPRPLLRRVGVDELTAELATFLGPECAAKGVRLSTASASEALQVRGDSPQIKTALLNLLLNALQATPAGGRVTIETGRRPNGIAITIRDTGIGVPAELRPRIFEPFVSGRPDGTGLGLAIAQRIVAGHAGSIEVETQAGRGSSFTIVLPEWQGGVDG